MSNVTMDAKKNTKSGKISFQFLIGLLSVFVIWSLFIAGVSLFSQHDLAGTNNKTPWGLLIAAYAFFVSSIGACFIGSLGSVFGIKKYVAIEKKAIFLAIVVVFVGMAIIFVELGRPLRMFIGYAKTPNFTSPIWWMGVNYTLYLIFIIAEFIALLKNNYKTARISGVFALLAAVIAHSTVGSVFGVVHARPFWYGPYMPIDFILCAWIMGFAMMIIVSFSFAKDNENKAESVSLIESMGKWLAVFIAIDMFFIFWKITTGLYGGEGAKYLATAALTTGPLSARFWGLEIILGLIAPFILLTVPVFKRSGNICLAAILSLVGMFVNKLNMVQAGQIVPSQVFNYDTYLKYSPSMVEVSIVAGAIAFVVLIYNVTEKYYFVAYEN